MFIRQETHTLEHVRISKLGKEHTYKRNKTVAVFRCDNCDAGFERDLKNIDHRRLRDMPASSTLPINKY